MKKLTYILLAAAAIIATVSCSKEKDLGTTEVNPEEVLSNEGSPLINPITLTFSAEAMTKVSISGEGTEGQKTAVWDTGDQIKIVWYNGEMKSANASVDAGGNASASFTATVEDAAVYYAVYPATVGVTLDGDGNFTVKFPSNANASTTFGGAAWYAAKTTAANRSFAFHPLSTVIKFTLDGSAVADPEQVYFRSMNGGLHKLCGNAALTFESDNTFTAAATATDGAAHVTFNVAGAGTYYVPIPAYGASETTGADGFVFQIKKTGETIPAAYYSATITQEPGKFYNIKSAIDGKVIRNYYVATSSQGTGDGLSQANAATLADLKANAPAFLFGDKIAGALLLDGATINFLGDDSNPYTEPIGVFNTSNSTYSYTIVGGVGGETTTFTTTAASTFNKSTATVTVQNVTFSGCTTKPAVAVSSGTVYFNNVNFTNCAAKGVDISGGTFTMTGGTISDFNASNNAIVISKEPTVTISGVSFSNNNCTGQQGGPIRMQSGTGDGPTVTLENCSFTNNQCTKSSGQGGAIYIGTDSHTTISGCTFDTNSATNGGAIMVAGSDSSTDDNLRVSFTNCLFHANASTATGTVGGGAACAGQNTAGGIISFNNCRFDNDTAPQGAAFYTASAVAAFFNGCTFYQERATKTDNTAITGYTIYSNNTSARIGINNCTFQCLNSATGVNNASNGTTLRSSGYGVIANTTIWSSAATGKRAMVMVGRGPSVAGSAPEDNTIVNCVIHEKSASYNAVFLNENYKVQVLYSLIDGFTLTPDGTTQVVTGCFDRGLNQAVPGADNKKDQPYNGIKHNYYPYTFNSATYSDFTPASKTYVNNAIRNTTVIGELFYNWLDSIGALDIDIMGRPRNDNNRTPGSYEIGGWS